MTGNHLIDAEQAFTRASRRRRRAAIAARLRSRRRACELAVFDQTAPAVRTLGIREIPLDAIGGTLEPSRAALFDACFRPAPAARGRWQRLWMAEQQGTPLPPVELVQVGSTYAVSDGHHRVSVARARGAATIDASVVGRAGVASPPA